MAREIPLEHPGTILLEDWLNPMGISQYALAKAIDVSPRRINEIDPGKPWQNGTTESFNGKFRDECLAMEWFRNRIEAKVVIEDWRQHYNTVRPHSSLNYATPEAFSRTGTKDLLTGAVPS